MNGTHHLIPTARILRPFRRATVTVGNNGGVHNLIPDARGDVVGARDTMTNGWDSWNCFYFECLLGGES